MNTGSDQTLPPIKGATPRPPLRLGYCVQNPGLAAVLLAWDTLCRILPRRSGQSAGEIRRVLIANWAHLGDALIAASLIPLLRTCFPDVKIGFLAGSWSRAAVETLRGITWIHTLDHWRLSRLPTSLRCKVSRYLADRRTALEEIRSVGYDVAIETYHFFPNSASLLWQAGIPRRIGYTSGGGGPLFTDALRWMPADRHLAAYHRDLLGALVPASLIPMPAMPEIGTTATVEPAVAGVESPYIVVHMGAGNPLKEWPEWKWSEVTAALADEGYRMVFTGRAEREAAAVKRACRSLSCGIDLCDRLEWNGWVELIRSARLLIGSDSAAGHVAASTHTPSVLIYSGMSNETQWRPLATQCQTLRYPTSCAPCYRSRGCSSMACVREVGVREVLEACRRALGSWKPLPIGQRGARPAS